MWHTVQEIFRNRKNRLKAKNFHKLAKLSKNFSYYLGECACINAIETLQRLCRAFLRVLLIRCLRSDTFSNASRSLGSQWGALKNSTVKFTKSGLFSLDLDRYSPLLKSIQWIIRPGCTSWIKTRVKISFLEKNQTGLNNLQNFKNNKKSNSISVCELLCNGVITVSCSSNITWLASPKILRSLIEGFSSKGPPFKKSLFGKVLKLL